MDDESWTTVKRGGRRKVGKLLTLVPKVIMRTDTAKRKNPSEADVAGLEKCLREYCARFKKSPDKDDFMRTLEKEISRRDGFRIDTAVCLALGAPSEDINRSEQVRRSRWQFAAFLEIVELLEKLGAKSEDENEMPRKVKMVAQDPRFEELDRRVLGRFGVQVTEHPAANEFITATSFLFAPFMEVNVLLEAILPGKDPMLYVGPCKLGILDYDNVFRKSGDVETMKTTVEEFLQDRIEVFIFLPAVELFDRSITGLSMYFRSVKDDEEEQN